MLVVAKNLSHGCCQHGCGQQPKVWRYKNEHEHISVVCALCLPVIVPRTCIFLLHWCLFFMSVSACQEQWSNKVRRNAEELSFGTCHFELSRLPASSAGGNGVGLLGGFRAVCQIHTRGKLCALFGRPRAKYLSASGVSSPDPLIRSSDQA